jgi:hypothetical protein
MFRRRLAAVRLAIMICFIAPSALARPLPDLAKPSGDIVLTVCGLIRVQNWGNCAALDLETLKALGGVQVLTSTIWTEGVQRFEGVPLKVLLERLGAVGSVVWARAANDYGAEIPVAETSEEGPIIAYSMNDRQMSLRDKGPLWIIYPYDADSRYRNDVVYSRSVWQLVALDVRD